MSVLDLLELGGSECVNAAINAKDGISQCNHDFAEYKAIFDKTNKGLSAQSKSNLTFCK
jgi:hypothetical protein